MSAITFTFAELNDLPNIVSTYNSTVASQLVTADLEPVSIESKLDWFHKHNTINRPLWLVQYNNNYAGWMSFNSFYGRPAYDGTVELSIYLEEAYRGLGLGKACLKEALNKAPAMNIHTLLGFIFGHNQPSLNLFTQFNFEKWAHLPKIANMNGVMRDLIIMGIRLEN
jgi:L-amino acid N-acyltransferase YncA